MENNFVIRHVSHEFEQTYNLRREKYPEVRDKMIEFGIAVHNQEMDYRYGEALDFKCELLREELVDIKYPNSPADKGVKFTYKVSFSYREYTGPTVGVVEVHRIEFTLPKEEKEAQEFYWKKSEEGERFVNSMIPEAVHRVGCYCCYGSGPDLKWTSNKIGEDKISITFTVDFDFERDDRL